MTEQAQIIPNTFPTEELVREKLSETFDDMAAYHQDNNLNTPYVRKEVEEFVHGSEPVPVDILQGYTAQLKFKEDRQAEFGNRLPNYYEKLEHVSVMAPENVRRLYESESEDGDLHKMISHQFSEHGSASWSISPALDVIKKTYGVDTVVQLAESHAEEPILKSLSTVLKGAGIKADILRVADLGNDYKVGSQELRTWMRNTLILASDITDPEQADAYTYAMSRATLALELGALDTLIKRVNSYGKEKLDAIKDFGNLSALASYSDAQLDRMYKLAQNDPAEIERLREHDVIVTMINMDGDHNGVSREVAERLDDESGRNLFFEITDPSQVYGYLKKLNSLGIRPTTLIFASHGTKGQFSITERPELDSDEGAKHVTLVADQELLDFQVSAANTGGKLKGYEVTRANGLVRSIQRFMQPSRAIDDPASDLGRKKIVSLSCEFDGEAYRAGLGTNGEVVRREKTTLLKRLGEVIVERLGSEHIDIYGADISTNQQTKTEQGFHYNTIDGGRWVPYPASVLRIDGENTRYEKVPEVLLRKTR